ncbi:DNA-binding protein [Streptomyces caelestis]|uniref:DNA-binding protein n=2 Tax=Streptomyces TaxID=1883 RepID=A0A0M8QG68_9ACTN|nr:MULTISPECIES: ComEA family DNA-binding protein [unclassified Streptomyces]KOT35875.1 DNA-binding protein [Streptomyces caelestis]KOV26218.1 DNA-binding protein [Streptomyces sp. XY152]
MALRSRSRTATATSGPGRPPASDGRARHRRPTGPRGRSPHRNRRAAAEEIRRRAESLFDDDRSAHTRRPPTWALTGTRRIRRAGSSADGNRAAAVGHLAGADRAAAADHVTAQGRSVTVARGGAGEHAATVRRAGSAGRPGPGDPPMGAGRPVAPGRAAAVGPLAAGSGGGAVAVDDEDDDVGPQVAGRGSGRGWRRERAGLALRERLPLWVRARCGMERRSVVALSVLLVVAVGFAVQHFWTGRTQPVRAPEVVRAAAVPHGSHDEGAAKGEAAPDGAVRADGSAGPEIVVDVSGKVRDPGIHRLPAGSRVEDALRAAGGVRPGTRTDTLNRARFLVDGEQVVVGGPAPTGAASGGGPAAPVSLNTATPDQLDALPGVGPVLAQHIVDYRTRNGGFRSVDELREVNGIGDRRFAELRNLVRP